MSWFFGSSKRKEPPPVTVDSIPIENEFCFIPSMGQTQPNSQSLYPDLSGTHPSNTQSLPYSPSPYLPAATSTGANTVARSQFAVVNETTNQLESVPFRIAPQLQADANGLCNENDASMKEFEKLLSRVKKFFNSAEFDYDFDLEKRILREAGMVNGHTTY